MDDLRGSSARIEPTRQLLRVSHRGAEADAVVVGGKAPQRLVAVGSRSHGSAETGEWLKRYEVERFVSRGSSLKFCLVAEGEADVYPRLGRTMEWDTAAGDAVLRAAGGMVTTLDGVPLRYGKRRQASDVDFANPHFVAFADPLLATKLAKDRV